MKLSNVGRVLAAFAVLAAAVAAAPAQAANATSAAGHATVRAADTCTPHTDSYSDERWASVRWRACLGDETGPNGYFQAKCWRGQLIGWSRRTCHVNGSFVIRDPQGSEVRSGYINLFSPEDMEEGRGVAYRFSCTGRPHGAYTFTITGAEAHLTYDAGYQPARIPDTTVTHTMC